MLVFGISKMEKWQNGKMCIAQDCNSGKITLSIAIEITIF